MANVQKFMEAMTVQTFDFFSRKVVWTAPISALRKLIGIGTALANHSGNEMKGKGLHGG